MKGKTKTILVVVVIKWRRRVDGLSASFFGLSFRSYKICI